MKVREIFASHFDFLILTGTTVLFIPFLGLSSTIDPVLMPRFFAWAIMSFVLLVSFVIRLCIKPENTNYSAIKRFVFVAFLGYLLFSLFSLTKAANITEGFYEVLKISLSIIYLFVATIILSKNRNYIPTLIKVVVISAVILSLIGFYEYFRDFSQKPGICNIKGTMAQKNQYSSALFLTLPFCLYSALEFRIRWKIISTVSTASILILILLNQTRSVWLSTFMATVVTVIVVLLLFIFRKSSISKETKAYFFKRFLYIVIVLVVAGTIFGCLYLRTNSIDFLGGRLDSIFSPTHKNNAIRISMWMQTLELAQDNLFMGVGAGNWKIAFPSYGIEELPSKNMFKTTFFVRPENDYVWILSEVGILGFMFYLSIFGIIFWYIFKILTLHTNTNYKVLSILMFFGFVGYMVFSCFTFPRERIFHSMFLLLMMAIVITIYHQSSGVQENVPRLLMFVLAIPCLCLLIFAIYIGHVRLNAEVYTKRALAARKAGNWPAVILEIDKGYSVFATLDPMSTPLQWYRGEANFLMNNISQAHEDFKKAHKAHPYHIHVLNNLATCYEMESDHERAIFYYKKALEIYPEFEDALINLGATYYNSGRYEEAYETLMRCNQNTQNPKLEEYLKAVEKELDREEKS